MKAFLAIYAGIIFITLFLWSIAAGVVWLVWSRFGREVFPNLDPYYLDMGFWKFLLFVWIGRIIIGLIFRR